MSTVPQTTKPPARLATVARPATAEVITLAEHGINIPITALTLDGYRAWATSPEFPERGRIVFLEERLSIDMSPEELETHAKLKGEINRSLLNLLRRLRLGEYYPDGVLLTNPAVGLSTEADAVFATWEELDSGRLQRVPREGVAGQFIEIEGTPSWVLEIVSNSSVGKDTRVLRDLYFRAGVEEYWLIDARGPEIQFQVLVRGAEGYQEVPARRGWVRSRVYNRLFRLTREQVRDHYWEYTLAVRAAR